MIEQGMKREKVQKYITAIRWKDIKDVFKMVLFDHIILLCVRNKTQTWVKVTLDNIEILVQEITATE